jgi:hypothetical protein
MKMKKTLLSTALLFSLLVNAQIKNNKMVAPTEPVGHLKKYNYSQLNKSMAAQKTNSITSLWFNYVDFIESVNPGLPTAGFMPLFPDSTIILGFTSGGAEVNPGYHKIGHYLDPYFVGKISIPNKTTTYTIDSVSFGYAYERHTSLGITDSVIVELIAENHALDYSLTGPPAFPYQDIEYVYTTNKLKSTITVLKRVAIALTQSDTCEGGLYKQIKLAVPGVAPQTNSKKIGTVISYKPGYTWTPADTLYGGHKKNIFWVMSVEQNGPTSDPTVYGTSGDYTSDMNMSMFLSTDTRYNIGTLGWNGFFIPTFAFTTPFEYESHDISYRLSVANVGINELESKGFSLNQNMPNPFGNESNIAYQLVKDAKSVVFTVTDVAGRFISSEKVNSNIGMHSISLSNYKAGLYYYTLNVDGITITKKMIKE